MATLLRISSQKAKTIRVSTRVLFLLIGASLILMEMVYPPVKTLWMVLGFLLAAILILYSIIGLSPRLRVSSFGEVLNNTSVHIAVSFIIGMGIIIAAMIHPPVKIMWYSFFNFVGVLLVFDAIITSSWNRAKLKKKLEAGGLSKHTPPTATA